MALSGVDADAVSVSVTLTDGTSSVSATAELDNNGAWTVSVADGANTGGRKYRSVAVDMTDDAGNTPSRVHRPASIWIPRRTAEESGLSEAQAFMIRR